MGIKIKRNVSYFMIFAEESAALGANEFEWAYGNGDNTGTSDGVVISIDCYIHSVGIDVEGGNGTAEVELYVNGVATGKRSGQTSTGTRSFTTFNDNQKIKAGDFVNFRTVTNGGAASGRASAMFKVVN